MRVPVPVTDDVIHTLQQQSATVLIVVLQLLAVLLLALRYISQDRQCCADTGGPKLHTIIVRVVWCWCLL